MLKEISGLTAFTSKKIRKIIPNAGEMDLIAGDLIIGGHYEFQYDSAADSGTGAYIVLNPHNMGVWSPAASGYVKHPSGVIQQWGSSTITLNAGGGAAMSFPTTFVSTCYTVVAVNGDMGAATFYVAINGTPTTSAFSFVCVTNPGAILVRINWMAFGL